MAKKTRQTTDKRSRQKISLLFLTIGVMAASSVMAQDSSQPVSVNDCQAIQDAAQRLSCYDSLFKTGEPAPNSIVDSKSTSQTDIQAPVSLQSPNSSKPDVDNFGDRSIDNALTRPVAPPRTKKAAAKIEPTEITSISQKVAKIDVFGYKKLRVTLENGQVWEQIGSVTQKAPKLSSKRPLVAEIRKAALGSFTLQFNGKGRDIKVRRVR